MLYADDTAIFAETAEQLQEGLNQTKLYCDRWKLELNASKCKVMIFSRGKVRVYPDFMIGNERLEVVSDFSYLGIRLNYNNRMNVTQKDVYDRASRAMFSLLKKSVNQEIVKWMLFLICLRKWYFLLSLTGVKCGVLGTTT